jgi:hypothetical protein
VGLRLRRPSGPWEEGASTSQGRPYAIFRRALERGNLLVAEATAKELPPLNRTDALEVARGPPCRDARMPTLILSRDQHR